MSEPDEWNPFTRKYLAARMQELPAFLAASAIWFAVGWLIGYLTKGWNHL